MLHRKIKGITSVFVICIIFTIIAVQSTQFYTENVSSTEIKYIIDAGHGIPDGGAVAPDGTTEQALNLAIVQKMSNILKNSSVPHLLTRSNENSIFTEGETIHAKKVSDIKNRISIANSHKSAPLISIHMNSFPEHSVHGIQVFYNEGNTEAKQLAETLQKEFNAAIQTNNPKVVKTISKNVYLFANIDNPSVLIECGFLSNSEELSKLKTPEYQEEIAGIIAKVLAGRN